jgi:hypothetical protein
MRASQSRMGRLQLRVDLDSTFLAASRRFGESRIARRPRSAKHPQGQIGRHRIRPHAWRADDGPPTRGTVRRPSEPPARTPTVAMIDGHRSSTPTSSGSWRRTCRPASAADRPTTSYSRRTTRVGTRGSCSSCGPRSARSTPAPSRPGSSSAAGPGPSASWRSPGSRPASSGRAPRAGDHRRPQVLPVLRAAGRREGGKWSGRADLNGRPPAPKAGALPGCATPRRPYPTLLYGAVG